MKVEAIGHIPDYCKGCPHEAQAVKAVALYHPCGTQWKLELSCPKQDACGHLWKRLSAIKEAENERL